jgi:hypothetical protein
VVQASLKAGVGYAFVVDGVGGEAGQYTIRYCWCLYGTALWHCWNAFFLPSHHCS